MATKRCKTRCNLKKISGGHRITSEEVIELVSFIDNLPEVTAINLGMMRSGLKSVQLRIKVNLRNKALRIMARGGPVVQEIWVYSKNLDRTMEQLLARNFA